LATSSGRRSGVRSLRLDTRRTGSIRRKRAIDLWACSSRPARAFVAEDTRSAK
jgi:hypothetical protein